MAAVKLVSLTKEYRNGENYIRAVDDVSFSIKEGEFIAVIGASGSGKSTLINLISGLEKPTHGCVYVHDVNLTQLSLEEQISFRDVYKRQPLYNEGEYPLVTGEKGKELLSYVPYYANHPLVQEAVRELEQLESQMCIRDSCWGEIRGW